LIQAIHHTTKRRRILEDDRKIKEDMEDEVGRQNG
jgi:hypothetical protein